MAKGPEARFSQRISRKLRMKGFWYYKIPDPRALDGVMGAAVRRPFDSIALTPDGRMLAIEFKVGRSVRDCLRKVKPHQFSSLDAVSKRGAIGALCFGIDGKTIWLDRAEAVWDDHQERLVPNERCNKKFSWKEEVQ